MPWDRNDWMAAALITTIIIIGIIAALWVFGVIPRSDTTTYPFG